MKYEDVKRAIEFYKKGQFFSIEYSKELPLLKMYDGDNIVVKFSRATVRMGIKYDNVRAVAEKRRTGELPQENQGLSWGVWDIPGYTIVHKSNIYLRVYPVKGNPTESIYYVNGVKKNEEVARLLCLKSAFSSSKIQPDTYAINIENIERIGIFE